jgi:hypothetical protein
MRDDHWREGRAALALLWRLWRMLYSFTYDLQMNQTHWPQCLFLNVYCSQVW